MLYILWVILNLGLLFYFLYLLYRAIVVVKREMGIFPVIFLILIIGGQCSHLKEEKKCKNEISYQGKEIFYSQRIDLSPINGLIVDCATDSAGNVIYKRSELTGTIVGVEWKPMAETFNNRYYSVVGVLKWHLLGINLWTQVKTFNGKLTNPRIAKGSFTYNVQ